MKKYVLSVVTILLATSAVAAPRDWMTRPPVVQGTGATAASMQELHRFIVLNSNPVMAGHATYADMPSAPGSAKIVAMAPEFEQATGLKWTVKKHKNFVSYSADWDVEQRHMVIFVQEQKNRLRVLTVHARSPWAQTLEREALQMAEAKFATKMRASNHASWWINEAYAERSKEQLKGDWIHTNAAEPGVVVDTDCESLPPPAAPLVNQMIPRIVSPQTRNQAKLLGVLSTNFVQDLQADTLFQTLSNGQDPRRLSMEDFKAGFSKVKDADDSVKSLGVMIDRLMAKVTSGQVPTDVQSHMQAAQASMANLGRNRCDFEVSLDSQIQQIDAALKGADSGMLCQKIKELVDQYNQAEQKLQDAKQLIARGSLGYFAAADREYARAGDSVQPTINNQWRELRLRDLRDKGVVASPSQNCRPSDSLSGKGSKRGSWGNFDDPITRKVRADVPAWDEFIASLPANGRREMSGCVAQTVQAPVVQPIVAAAPAPTQAPAAGPIKLMPDGAPIPNAAPRSKIVGKSLAPPEPVDPKRFNAELCGREIVYPGFMGMPDKVEHERMCNFFGIRFCGICVEPQNDNKGGDGGGSSGGGKGGAG